MAARCDVLCLDLPRAETLRQARQPSAELEALARRAGALADPTRLAVASTLLEGGELCVCDVAWIVERSQNLVSHHLRALRGHGLASARRDGKMVMYRLTDEGRVFVAAVMTRPAVPV